MASKRTDLILINGQPVPPPDEDLEILHSTFVDSARNLNGTVVGQVIGRPIWKLNNLQWSNISQEEWARIKQLLSPFFVPVTFTGDDGQRHTVTMYPGDRSATPKDVVGLSYANFKVCKFNLIDCGKSGES